MGFRSLHYQSHPKRNLVRVDFAGDDNNAKYECVTGKFAMASVTLAIILDVINDQLFILTANFYL